MALAGRLARVAASSSAAHRPLRGKRLAAHTTNNIDSAFRGRLKMELACWIYGLILDEYTVADA